MFFSTGNGQPREPALCQLFRHTSVPDEHRSFWKIPQSFALEYMNIKYINTCWNLKNFSPLNTLTAPSLKKKETVFPNKNFSLTFGQFLWFSESDHSDYPIANAEFFNRHKKHSSHALYLKTGSLCLRWDRSLKTLVWDHQNWGVINMQSLETRFRSIVRSHWQTQKKIIFSILSVVVIIPP